MPKLIPFLSSSLFLPLHYSAFDVSLSASFFPVFHTYFCVFWFIQVAFIILFYFLRSIFNSAIRSELTDFQYTKLVGSNIVGHFW